MSYHLNGHSEDPFKRLKDSVRLRLKEEMVEDQIFGVVQHTFSEILRTENIVLSQVERDRLLREVLKDTLDDMLLDLSGKG
jgi:hypothetical protein